MTASLALVGDYSPDVLAHRAIPRALALASSALGVRLEWQWLPTRDLDDAPRQLAAFRAVWVVPASPYAKGDGALAAIRFARETRRPFLGTCGGFQHALIEFARNAAGITSADHAETNPAASLPVIAPLACALVEQSDEVRFLPGSRLRDIYGSDTAHEGYHCRYGVNAACRTALERAGLQFTAFDRHGDIRAAELPRDQHPFFIGTLFQPERAALRDLAPPLVRALVAACARAPDDRF